MVIKPGLQLARDYSCEVRFRPFDLSYVDLGITTKHDSSDPKAPRVAPSKAADRRARMYYSVSREYAKAQGVSIRGAEFLLNSTAACMALEWVNKISAEAGAKFAFAVLDAGWPNGWREFDMADVGSLKRKMLEVGVPTVHVDAFNEYVSDEGIGGGREELRRTMDEAKEQGVAGVPHITFEIASSGKRVGWFGREHISFVRHQMHQLGLAKREDVSPDISHFWHDGGDAKL